MDKTAIAKILFLEGRLRSGSASTQIQDFSKNTLFPKILNLRPFGNS